MIDNRLLVEGLEAGAAGRSQTSAVDYAAERRDLRPILEIVVRLAPAVFFLAAVRGRVSELSAFISESFATHASSLGLGFYISIGSRLSVILFLSLMAALFIFRERPIQKAIGVMPRVTAITGTFLMSALTLFPRAQLGMAQTIGATFLVLLGTSLSVYVLYRLGRSFSLMAEARRLVTSGPYAIVRHPLYLTEEIAIIGVLLQFLSPLTLLICALHFAIQLQRMKNEESVLRSVFPEYVDYEKRTARLVPGLY